MGYENTFIAVADDCPATSGIVPPSRGAWPTVAMLHHRLMGTRPYALTQEDVLFDTWLAQQDPVPSGDHAVLRERFFAQPRPCLRSSPLGKRYGWGVHFDAAGRAALYAVDSAEYAALVAGGVPTVLKAFRTRRAQA